MIKLKELFETVKGQCSADVRIKGMNFPRYKPCTRKAVVVRNGKKYCKQCDPEKPKTPSQISKREIEISYVLREITTKEQTKK